MTRAIIIGAGHYLPKRIVTNDDMSKLVDTSDEWITKRTGIRQRHFASTGENASHLAIKAALAALDYAGIAADTIDVVIVATATPDLTFPSTACIVQREIGAINAFSLDLNAACAGYIVGLSIVDAYIKTGQAKRIMLIGSEVFSRLVNMADRNTCVLFGDGAGAIIFEASKANDAGIIKTQIKSAPEYQHLLQTTGGIGATQTAGYIEMTGREVYRHAVKNLTRSGKEIFNDTTLGFSDIDWLIPHQANIRIIEHVAKELNLSMEKVITTVDKHANTSAASIPLALSCGMRDGRVKKGDLVLHEAIGGGLVWGSSLVRM